MRAPKRRGRRTRTEMERLAGEFHRAGNTQAEFARRHGVHPLTVAGWIRRFPKPTNSREPDPKFVAVKIRPAVSAPPVWLEMVSPSGLRLRFAADCEAAVHPPVLEPPRAMLSFLATTRVFLAAGDTDLRKSFDTLAGVVRGTLQLDPLSGHLFVFTNGRRNRLKILFWDRNGWWLCSRRLEMGTFRWPSSTESAIELSPEELTLLVAGIDLKETTPRKWRK